MSVLYESPKAFLLSSQSLCPCYFLSLDGLLSNVGMVGAFLSKLCLNATSLERPLVNIESKVSPRYTEGGCLTELLLCMTVFIMLIKMSEIIIFIPLYCHLTTNYKTAGTRRGRTLAALLIPVSVGLRMAPGPKSDHLRMNRRMPGVIYF